MFNNKFAVAADAVVLIDHNMFSSDRQHDDGQEEEEAEGDNTQPAATKPLATQPAATPLGGGHGGGKGPAQSETKSDDEGGAWQTVGLKKQRTQVASKIRTTAPLPEAEEESTLALNLATLPMPKRWALFNLWRQRTQARGKRVTKP